MLFLVPSVIFIISFRGNDFLLAQLLYNLGISMDVEYVDIVVGNFFPHFRLLILASEIGQYASPRRRMGGFDILINLEKNSSVVCEHLLQYQRIIYIIY